MQLNILRIVYALVCAGAIVAYIVPESEGTFVQPGTAAEGILNADPNGSPAMIKEHPYLSAIVLMLLTQSATIIDLLIRKKRIETISAIYFGLLIGVLLSYMLIQAMALGVTAQTPIRNIAVLIISLVVPYFCISFLLQTKDDFRFVIPYVEFARDLKGGKPLVLDSSALIDGRIADVVETRILDAELIVPQFVLQEVQDIADSSDKNRRNRGRRGLEVLSKLQNNPQTEIHMNDSQRSDFNGMSTDHCLVALAKQLNGRIVTNDFNLNKVASVQGIKVVNLNEVANALKPRFLPGDHLQIRILKEGESAGQGIGYLDDGTMVVCEQASNLVGKQIDVIVTSALQSSAGRMIFGKQVDSTQQS